MTLPEVVLPKIVLPFDIPVLLHPVVDHFLIALPVGIFLLEVLNLIFKKRAIGGVSFFLLILTVVAGVLAYFTGIADAKDAYSTLSEVAKTALSEHKLLGTYILLGSGLLLVLKILAMSGAKVFKGLYFLIFIIFLLLLCKQGKEGGELVYKYGVNVEAVASLKDKLLDTQKSVKKVETVVKKTEVTPVLKNEQTIENTPAVLVEKVKESNQTSIDTQEEHNNSEE